MTASTFSRILATKPRAPEALRRLLADFDQLRSRRTVLSALSADPDSASVFLFVTRRFLPGRRMGTVREAIQLLGETMGQRLALLASGVHWLRGLLEDDATFRPLLRHSIACAIASEPLGRDSGIVDPLMAYTLGLLHHVGDFAIHARRDEHGFEPDDSVKCPSKIAVELLKKASAPQIFRQAIVEFETFAPEDFDRMCVEAKLLAAADYAVSRLGYAPPTTCPSPRFDGPRVLEMADSVLRNRRRLCASIEDALTVVFEVEERAAAAIAQAKSVSEAIAPAHPSALDATHGVSVRDLGPLPVLFARITDAIDMEAVEVALTGGLVEELNYPRAYFLRVKPDKSQIAGGILCSRGNVPLPLDQFHMPVQHLPHPLRRALDRGHPVQMAGTLRELEFLLGERAHATAYVPVLAGDETLGLLAVEIESGQIVSLDLLAAIASHVGLAMRSTTLVRLSTEATTDQLTGLKNRRGILEHFDRALALPSDQVGKLGIALIDCDHLKKVNDNFGHLMGDEFVRRISEVVRNTLRTDDEMGRYGGDEFLAVLPDVTPESLHAILERCRILVDAEGMKSTDGLLLSISVGGVAQEGRNLSREDLLKLADSALYRAKERGRNAVEVVRADGSSTSLS
ncbi:MAG: diguanylate cyclase [Planctomycetes bacterium]|nr:diguanylate cyclase [Planctomycetota bacterium]MCC7168951.1 diguanylate cyclase [Planctomycetota bacterium]